MDQHGDVVAPLRVEHSLEPEFLERCAHAGQKLPGIDRFREVRVRPFLETGLDRMRFAPRRREHDHRRTATAARTQPAQHFDAIESGHRDVEQHELRLPKVDLTQGFHTARGGAYAMAVLRQQGFVEREGIVEVVHDEEVAAGIPICERRRLVDHERASPGRSRKVRPVPLGGAA